MDENKISEIREKIEKNKEKKKSEDRAAAKAIAIIIVVIFGIITFFNSFKTIKSGEVGIKVRFGRVIKTEMNDGINLKIPFIEKIIKMNVQVQKTELDTTNASKDLQDVKMKLAVNFRVLANKATSLYKNVGVKYNETILQPSIQEAIKSVTSQYTAEELITKRAEVSIKCMSALEDKVKKYGLSIDNFNIVNFSFSEEFDKAIEEKQVAEQRVLTAKQELEKEKIEAEKRIVAAEADKKSNELKQQSLTDNVIKEKFINKWNGELPKVSGGASMLDISSILSGK